MTERPDRTDDRRDEAAVPNVAPDHLLDALAAGAHDDTLVRLGAAHLLADAEAKAWGDARFMAWWAEEQRAGADASARHVTDAHFLAAGAALRSRVHARRLGIACYQGSPRLRRATIVAPPSRVIDDAARVHATPVVDLGVAAGVGRELWDEPAEMWLELPDGLPAGRYLAVRIDGDSMEPAMSTGDTVLVGLGLPPKTGAAVVARHPDDGYVCKRVRRLRAATIELESLAPDRPLITLPRRDDLVLGVVVAVWRG
jgi:SOS-response transcriptional repressor LexA